MMKICFSILTILIFILQCTCSKNNQENEWDKIISCTFYIIELNFISWLFEFLIYNFFLFLIISMCFFCWGRRKFFLDRFLFEKCAVSLYYKVWICLFKIKLISLSIVSWHHIKITLYLKFFSLIWRGP
jgi:hypothetical protein